MGRWFYSYKHDVDRLDGMVSFAGEDYIASVYQYFDKQVEDVILERPGELDCFSRNLTFSMPKPKFNEFTYVGQSVLNYQHANHWVIVGPASPCSSTCTTPTAAPTSRSTSSSLTRASRTRTSSPSRPGSSRFALPTKRGAA